MLVQIALTTNRSEERRQILSVLQDKVKFASVAASVTGQAEQVRAFSKIPCIHPAWGAFTESPFSMGKTCSASTVEPPFQRHHFLQPWALMAVPAVSPNLQLSPRLGDSGIAMGPAAGQPRPNPSRRGTLLSSAAAPAVAPSFPHPSS